MLHSNIVIPGSEEVDNEEISDVVGDLPHQNNAAEETSVDADLKHDLNTQNLVLVFDEVAQGPLPILPKQRFDQFHITRRYPFYQHLVLIHICLK